ncbi:MAG: type II toxin-antitoxin system VapC family toxin [Chloroflexota bacterium]
MAVFVVDASIVISRFVKESYTPQTIALFARLKSGDFLYIPEFCRLECINVLWKHVRFQGVARAQAMQSVQDLLALPLTIVPAESVYIRALTIGLDHQLAIYDSIYIALAEKYQCPLITADVPQQRAAMAVGVTLKPVTEFRT